MPMDGCRSADRPTVHPDHPAVVRKETGDQLEQRALAATAWTNQRDELAVGGGEGDVVERVHLRVLGTVDEADTFDSDDFSAMRSRLHQFVGTKSFVYKLLVGIGFSSCPVFRRMSTETAQSFSLIQP